MKKLWLILTLSLFSTLTHCSSSGGDSAQSNAPLPLLTSPARAQAWGSPEISKNANGYRATYTNPSNAKEKLTIIGSSAIMPFFVYPPNIKGTKTINGTSTQINEPQLWKKGTIRGQTVKWYQSSLPTSQKAAQFRSLGIELKNQSGGRGQYRIEVEGTKDQVQTWMSELRFPQ